MPKWLEYVILALLALAVYPLVAKYGPRKPIRWKETKASLKILFLWLPLLLVATVLFLYCCFAILSGVL